MDNCIDCVLVSCPDQGHNQTACAFIKFAPEFEVYTFNERTGSENIHLFYTQEAADAFLRRQPSHLMAH